MTRNRFLIAACAALLLSGCGTTVVAFPPPNET